MFLRVQVHDCVVDAAPTNAFAQDEPGSAVACMDESAAKKEMRRMKSARTQSAQ
jgi:hypothetical protein